MSASEYLPLYQSFTNRTHIKTHHWLDQSKIAQIIDVSKCCLEMYRRYVNSSIAYILVSVCPADGITSCCPIWVDTIKKWISIKIWRAFVQYKAAYTVDTVWWLNFGLSKMDHSRQCLYNIEQIVQHSEAHPSSWGSMNCYQNDYGWKSSVVKTTTKIHILSMIRSMNIIQIGKSSTVLKMRKVQ